MADPDLPPPQPDRSYFGSDPFAPFRHAGQMPAAVGELEFPMLLAYEDVRRAAQNWQQFTSDTPFEVPIPHEHDVRPVRQLPIETDPPLHGELRHMVDRFFTRRAVEAHAPYVAALVDQQLAAGLAAGRLDVIADLALPVVNDSLALVLGRPLQEAEFWRRWGVHVFHADGDGVLAANDELDRYLVGVVDEVRAAPDDGFFGALARATIDGRPLTHDEMIGFGNLVFAGGRDTVANAIGSSVAYLAAHRDALAWLQADPTRVRVALEEILRLRSPLVMIGRHATGACRVGDAELADGDLVALGFAAANRDPQAFADADACDLARWPNRHVAFGYGPHTCLGVHLARMEIRVVLERLVATVGSVTVLEPPVPRMADVGPCAVAFGVDGLVVALGARD